MLKKKLLTMMFIAVLPVAYIYFFFYYPQRNEYYRDVNHLVISYKKSNNEIVQAFIPLIPENAQEIIISYRINRIKNISISFKLPDMNWKSYISIVKEKLKNYSISALPQADTDKIVYFWGTPDTLFSQIDISVDGDYITIQSF